MMFRRALAPASRQLVRQQIRTAVRRPQPTRRFSTNNVNHQPPPLPRGTPAVKGENLDSKTAGVLKYLFKKYTAVKVAGVVAGPLLAGLWFWRESEGYITSTMVDTFAKGVDGLTPKDATVSVERGELLTSLRTILAPTEITNYVVILGEKGVGKSTAVRQTLAQLESPRGAIYVMAPEHGSADFLETLQVVSKFRQPSAFVLRIKRWVDGVTYQKTGEPTPDDLGKALFAKLKVVGAAYLAKYGRPPVLVVDGADVLYKKNPEFLTDLQTLAKNAADANTLRVVFVMSEKPAFEMLQSHSHSSRSKIFVVGDIDDNEAVKFLVSSGVDKANAQDAVARITGGRFALLNDYVADHQDGLTNDQILANYHAATDTVLYSVGVNATDQSMLLREVSTGSLKAKRAMELVGDDKLAQLTRENVLTVNPSTRLVTFNSRHIQTFFTETGVLWPIVCCRSRLAHDVLCLFEHDFRYHCGNVQLNSEYADSLMCFLGGDDA